jgi:hypothetical protein
MLVAEKRPERRLKQGGLALGGGGGGSLILLAEFHSYKDVSSGLQMGGMQSKDVPQLPKLP